MSEALDYLRATVERVVPENASTSTLVLDQGIQADPGQFMMLWVPGVDEKPFSLAGCDPIQFTIRRAGPVSRYLCGLRPGDEVRLRGPLGKGFSLRGRAALLVGGGYGAAPLGFLAHRASAQGCSCILAVGAATAQQLLVPDTARRCAEILRATEDGSEGFHGMVTGVVASVLDSQEVDCVYACGPNPMLDAVGAMCRSAEIPAQLCYESYMRCGLGICGSCEHHGLLVCTDGPVFCVEP